MLTTLREELGKGIPPGSRLMEGALVVMGGMLLQMAKGRLSWEGARCGSP